MRFYAWALAIAFFEENTMPIAQSHARAGAHPGAMGFALQGQDRPPGLKSDRRLPAAPVAADAPIATTALTRQVQRALATKAQGIPAAFADAWEWAAHWTALHGVTLPPDTSELRSLRNFFCYQVGMFKKNQLSPKSAAKFAQHGIDLARYQAPGTGSGDRLDDEACLQLLQAHYASHGSYDLQEDSPALLLAWQTRLLKTYCTSGQSGRMRALAAALPGFSYGHWLKPGEAAVPSSEFSWWSRAREFRTAAKTRPPFRGRIDPEMSVQLRLWASEQIALLKQGSLSSRQRGELLSMDICARASHRRSQEKASLLASARSAISPLASETHGTCQRDVTHFLGASLLVTLVRHGAGGISIYRKLGVYPAQYARMQMAIEPVMLRLEALATKSNLSLLRAIHRDDPAQCESLAKLGKLPVNVYADLTTRQARRLEVLAQGVLEIRDSMRRMHVRQELPAVGKATQ